MQLREGIGAVEYFLCSQISHLKVYKGQQRGKSLTRHFFVFSHTLKIDPFFRVNVDLIQHFLKKSYVTVYVTKVLPKIETLVELETRFSANFTDCRTLIQQMANFRTKLGHLTDN